MGEINIPHTKSFTRVYANITTNERIKKYSYMSNLTYLFTFIVSSNKLVIKEDEDKE